MQKGDLIRLQAPARDDIAVFIERLSFGRMCAVEIIKERAHKKYKSVDNKQKGVRYLTKQKHCIVMLTSAEWGSNASLIQ